MLARAREDGTLERLMSRGLSEGQAAAAIRQPVEATRERLRPHRAGRKRESYVEQWAAQLADSLSYWHDRERLGLLEELQPGVVERAPGGFDICLAIAETDYDETPTRWTYAPAEQPRKAASRVWTAVERHRKRTQ
jgi:hypothetical protein